MPRKLGGFNDSYLVAIQRRGMPRLYVVLGGDYTQAKVDCLGRVCERTHANVVDAGLGVLAHILQVDAAGSFKRNAPRMAADAVHTGAHQIRSHVIEQQRLSAMLQGLFEFGHGTDLDLDRLLAATVAMRALERQRHSAGHGNVVVLDQHAVGEIETMIVSAATGDRIFIEDAQAGDSFTSVEDTRLGTRDLVYELSRERG